MELESNERQQWIKNEEIIKVAGRQLVHKVVLQTRNGLSYSDLVDYSIIDPTSSLIDEVWNYDAPHEYLLNPREHYTDVEDDPKPQWNHFDHQLYRRKLVLPEPNTITLNNHLDIKDRKRISGSMLATPQVVAGELCKFLATLGGEGERFLERLLPSSRFGPNKITSYKVLHDFRTSVRTAGKIESGEVARILYRTLQDSYGPKVYEALFSFYKGQLLEEDIDFGIMDAFQHKLAQDGKCHIVDWNTDERKLVRWRDLAVIHNRFAWVRPPNQERKASIRNTDHFASSTGVRPFFVA